MVRTLHTSLFGAGLVFCLASIVLAYSGGSGTEADPYQIGTVADWNDLMNTPSDWDANFIATADINLQDVPLIPVGNDINGTSIYFRGAFDGNGHTISNASINIPGQWHIGLFGLLHSNGKITNLGLEDVNMSGGRDTAGLAGLSNGTISNCYVTGKVIAPLSLSAGGPNYGGLVGLNRGPISGCHTCCDVNSGRDTGGLVGCNQGGVIIDSYASGTVNGDRNVGGLIGENTFAPYPIDPPRPSDEPDYSHPGTVSRCYAAGSVSGNQYVGGLVGTNGSIEGGFLGGAPISDCYSTCIVKGISYGGINSIGGLVGANYTRTRPTISDNINHCYAAGRVDANGGGLIGPPFPPIPLLLNNFWDINVTGQTKSGGGTGKTTVEMMTLSTFISAGWDFVNETTNGPNDIWFIREGKEYPRFVWENNKPVADAGHDQTVYAWIDGIAEVTLDGSDSYDNDGDELSYLWKWSIDGNTYDTNSVNPTIEMPVGIHKIELVVNDGWKDSEPNEVTETIVGPIEGTLRVTPRIINGRCGHQRITAILRLPEGIRRQQIDAGKKLMLYPGEIEASYQIIGRYFERRTERVFILACFDASALIDAVGSADPVQLNVVGQLKTGQYFYGSDRARIINPPRRPPWQWWGWSCTKY